MIKLTLTYNEEFILQAYKRFTYGKKLRKSFRIIGVISLILLSCMGGFIVSIGSLSMGMTILGFPLLVAGSLIYQNVAIRRDMRQSPFRDDEVTITLTDSNFEVTSPIQSSVLSWDVFTKAEEFSDGCLIYQGNKVCNWLPTSSIIDSSLDDLRDFLKQKITDYHIIKN